MFSRSKSENFGINKVIKKLLGFINGKRGSQILPFVFKMLRHYLQNGAALIIGYLNIAWTTKLFHQVALLATMCFCLISTPAYGPPRNTGKLEYHLISYYNRNVEAGMLLSNKGRSRFEAQNTTSCDYM